MHTVWCSRGVRFINFFGLVKTSLLLMLFISEAAFDVGAFESEVVRLRVYRQGQIRHKCVFLQIGQLVPMDTRASFYRSASCMGR